MLYHSILIVKQKSNPVHNTSPDSQTQGSYDFIPIQTYIATDTEIALKLHRLSSTVLQYHQLWPICLLTGSPDRMDTVSTVYSIPRWIHQLLPTELVVSANDVPMKSCLLIVLYNCTKQAPVSCSVLFDCHDLS